MKLALALTLAPLCSLACVAPATQTTPAVRVQDDVDYGSQKGDSLLSAAFSLSSSSPDGGEDITTVVTQLGAGFFLTQEHEVGGQILYASSDSGAFDSEIISIAPYYNYNWRQSSRTWFYAGPHLGVQIIDTGFDDSTELSFGVHGGLRQWLTPSTSVFVEPRFTTSDELDDFTLLVGLSIAWGFGG